jgi:hypothetical protein
MFVVKYKVLGNEHQTEEYTTYDIAEGHLRDIAGYEGITEARVEPVGPKRAIDRLLERE